MLTTAQLMTIKADMTPRTFPSYADAVAYYNSPSNPVVNVSKPAMTMK